MPDILVLSTDCDAVTQTLYGYAQSFIGRVGLSVDHLHNEDAAGIRSTLKKNPTRALFLFLHGSELPPGVTDHEGNLVIGKKTAKLLKSCIVCGTCYSLNGFGDLVASQNGTVVGYDGVMWVPVTNPKAEREMESAALAVHDALCAKLDAEAASEKAKNEYERLADQWYRGGTVEGQLLGAIAILNSGAIGVKGNARATL
jgi:hypothetical protein